MKYPPRAFASIVEEGGDVIWRGRPWIGPSLAARTIEAVVAIVFLLAMLSALHILVVPVLAIPLYALVAGVVAVIWLVSIAGLYAMRASNRYVIRKGSVEVDRGIVGRRSLVVSPSAFSELEVDQGIVGRMLNYGSLAVRSQGGQQLNLRLIRNPKGVSAKIREVMTVPTVRIAKEAAPQGAPTG